MGRSSTLTAASDKYLCILTVPRGVNVDSFPSSLRRDCLVLCSLVHWKWLNWKADPEGWVRLRYEYLRNLINDRKLRNVIETLVNCGVMERGRSYRAGRYSKSYRIAPGLRQTQFVTFRSKPLKRRLTALECPKLPVHKFLEGELQHLTINLPEAQRFIAQLLPDTDCKLTVNEYRALVLEQCACVEQGYLPLNRDPYDRCHTPFTRFPRALRSCLTFYGEPLVGFDLANSQPLFAALLAILHFVGFGEKLRCHEFHRHANSVDQSYLEEIETLKLRHISRGGGGVVGGGVVGGGVVGGLLDLLPLDLGGFFNACVAGRFYESLDTDRDRVKRALMPILAGPVNYTNSRIVRQFKTLYPTVDRMLEDLKTHNRLPESIRHKHSSRLLQHIEASFFIGRVCQQAMVQQVPVITLHDGLFTTRAHYSRLLTITQNEFHRLGFQPKFKKVRLHADSTKPV